MLSVELYVKISRKRLCFFVLLIFAAMESIKGFYNHRFKHDYEFYAENFYGYTAASYDQLLPDQAMHACLFYDRTLPVLHNKYTARKFKEYLKEYVKYYSG